MATWVFVLLFCAVYVSTFTTNKYVLSVLKFTFPTIFQGWQTAFGLGLMLVCSAMNVMKISLKSRKEVLSWIPGIGFFILSIFSGSKALSVLPLPAFVACQNMVDVNLYMFKVVQTRRTGNAAVVLSAIMVLGSGLAAGYSDPQYSIDGYRWMAIHVLSTSLLAISQTPESFSDVDCLFYQYLSSVLVFLPGSILLGDVSDAYYFTHWYKLKFYVGCLLSGLLGVLLNVTTMQMRVADPEVLPVATAMSKTILVVSSEWLFDAVYTSDFVFSLLVNMTTYYVFLWLQPVGDRQTEEDETSVKLSREVA